MTLQYEIPSFLSMFYICVGKNVSWECSFFQWSKEHEGAFLIMKKGLLTSPLKFLTLGSGWKTWIKSLKIFIPIHLLSSIDDMQKKWSLKTWTFWQSSDCWTFLLWLTGALFFLLPIFGCLLFSLFNSASWERRKSSYMLVPNAFKKSLKICSSPQCSEMYMSSVL